MDIIGYGASENEDADAWDGSGVCNGDLEILGKSVGQTFSTMGCLHRKYKSIYTLVTLQSGWFRCYAIS